MKVTKIVYSILCVSLLFACSSDESNKLLNGDDAQFIRFFLLVDSNNNALEYPNGNGSLSAVSEYNKEDIKTLKIPVALTSTEITESTTATFTTFIDGDIDLGIEPAQTLRFSPTKLVDTISVTINKRWDFSQTPQLKLSLTEVSNSDIQIGMPNTLESNDELIVSFNEPSFQYGFDINRIEITGEPSEEIEVKVNFPLGYFSNDIDETEIFSFLNGFDYSISKTSQDANSMTFKIILNEAINNDDVYYQTVISLEEYNGYVPSGNSVLQIVKPIQSERDVNANPASHFYDLSDQYYRTYGETWNDFNDDGICQWSNFNAFTYPVIVDANNPNAILYDDLGTADTSDDIYHDAFKIGFNSTISTSTTNSFNLKRWFSNESSSSANSPGFNISPALEFFPTDGTSKTNGTVLVIPQYLTLESREGNSHVFAISGEGTYEEISAGLFEIKFQLHLSNDDVLGGTVTAEYRLYNSRSYTDPEDLTTTNCLKEYAL
ncbi:hypothetical protein RBH94_12150 [Aestuariibaculum sp. YM273]|uniref:hypothetical protein n=1 Tax=Aestuariibaculum sp. YM273 TaxID=3070659 RepID=UPI0027DE4982|nr:hypothetical protein [Aestuariibaculum sp. YM273]WMI64811.1 hypothetical protein RBH94_12150 [Aestuariibaculum sp. YM273]